MNKRITAVVSSISNSFCDFSLDVAVNKYSIYKILLYTSIISLFFQVLYSFYVGISITAQAVPIILIRGLIVLLGYLCYVNTLKNLPIGLAALLENLDLFIVLIIDVLLGNLIITSKFIFLFLLFIISVLWFTLETNKIKDEIKFKKIRFIGILFILLSVLFYAIEPYTIKYVNKLGANEVAINFGYSVVAIPFFFFKSRISGASKKENNDKKFFHLVVVIGLFEAIYLIFGFLFIDSAKSLYLFVYSSIIFMNSKLVVLKLIFILLPLRLTAFIPKKSPNVDLIT